MGFTAGYSKRSIEMDELKREDDLNSIYGPICGKYYHYCYLESMHDKIAHEDPGDPYSTLILGLSYGIMGVETEFFDKPAINLAMHNQDLFYDMMHIYRIMQSANHFTDCVFVLGYYSFYFDLSMGINKENCLKFYAPLFGTVHHALEYQDLIGRVKALVSDPGFVAWYHTYFTNHPSYYGAHYIRESDNVFFGPGREFSGNWLGATEEDRRQMAEYRAGRHNKIRYPHTFQENVELFGMAVKMLDAAGIRAHVVIPPFSEEYLELIDPGFKEEMIAVLDDLPYLIDFMDFNEVGGFGSEDFADPDHLNLQGAIKFSKMLNEILLCSDPSVEVKE